MPPTRKRSIIIGAAFGARSMYVRCARCGARIPMDDVDSGRAATAADGGLLCRRCAGKEAPEVQANVEATVEATVEESASPSDAARVERMAFFNCAGCGKILTEQDLSAGGAVRKTNGTVLCGACAAKQESTCDRCGAAVPKEDIQNGHALVTEDGQIYCKACLELVRPLLEAMHGGRRTSRAAPRPPPHLEQSRGEPPPRHETPGGYETRDSSGSQTLTIVLIAVGVVIFVVILALALGDRSGSRSGSRPSRPGRSGRHEPTRPHQPPRVDREQEERLLKEIDSLRDSWTPAGHASVLRRIDAVTPAASERVQMHADDVKRELEERMYERAEQEYRALLKQAESLRESGDYEAEAERLEHYPAHFREEGDFWSRLQERRREALQLVEKREHLESVLSRARELESDGRLQEALDALRKAIDGDLRGTEFAKRARSEAKRLKAKIAENEKRLRREALARWEKVKKSVEKLRKLGAVEAALRLAARFARKEKEKAPEAVKKYIKEMIAKDVVPRWSALDRRTRDFLASSQKPLSTCESLMHATIPYGQMAEAETVMKEARDSLLRLAKVFGETVGAVTSADVSMDFLKEKTEGGRRRKVYSVKMTRPETGKVVFYQAFKLWKPEDDGADFDDPEFVLKLPDTGNIRRVDMILGVKNEEPDSPCAAYLSVDGRGGVCTCVLTVQEEVGFALDAAHFPRRELRRAEGEMWTEPKGTLNLLRVLKRPGTHTVRIRIMRATEGAASRVRLSLGFLVHYKNEPSTGGEKPPRKTVKPPQKKTITIGEWTDIFNGKDLTDWRTSAGVKAKVESGILVAENTTSTEQWLYFHGRQAEKWRDFEIQMKLKTDKGRYWLVLRVEDPNKDHKLGRLKPGSIDLGEWRGLHLGVEDKKIYAVASDGTKRIIRSSADLDDSGSVLVILAPNTKLEIEKARVKVNKLAGK